jgi:hypothetical protein
MDYYFRGTGHIHGGIGVFARAVADTIEKLGGQFVRAKPLGPWRIQAVGGSWKQVREQLRKRLEQALPNTLPTHLFEGRVDGEITHERIGTGGFGYDPIFRPDGSEKTFGEMSLEEKSKFSHRSRAVAQLVSFLKNK